MKTIVVTSQKGGSAKTTLTALLAVEAERAGDGPVWLIDTDKQGSLTRWHDRREADTPQRAEIPFRELGKGLEAIGSKHGGALCFIDTAPAISDQSATIIGLADLVLIPVQASPSDLWAVAETIELVREAGKPFCFVITRAKPQASITAQSVAALSRHGRVAQHFMADRVAYAVALAGGNTAPELQARGSAAQETAALWQELKSCFAESGKIAKQQKVNHG